MAGDKNQNSKANEPVILESLLMVGLRATVAFLIAIRTDVICWAIKLNFHPAVRLLLAIQVVCKLL